MQLQFIPVAAGRDVLHTTNWERLLQESVWKQISAQREHLAAD